MRTSTRMIAIACAVATGPLLAHAAIGIRDYVSSTPDEEGFTLDGGGFIDPGGGGLSPQCVWDGDVCVVTGGGGDDWWPGGGGGGGGWGGGGGGGGDCSNDPSRCEGDPPPTGPEALPVLGRNCPAELTAAETAKNLLYANSPTARQMMDAAAVHGVYIQVVQIDPALAGGQPRDRFYPETGAITWDPFVYARGVNQNGSPWELSPIMLLAHELVHAAHRYNPAYQGEDSEAVVMALANQIAAEMNAAIPNSNYNTNRDNHIRLAQHYSSSVTAASFTIARPSCD